MNNFFNKLSLSTPWDQKLAYLISKPFIFFKIHPNIVTFIGILFGAFAFIFYYFGNLFYAKVASLLFFVAALIFGYFFSNVSKDFALSFNCCI